MSNFGIHPNNLSLEKQLYLLQTLPAHLAEASQVERLRRLLTDFAFLEAKVSTLGPQPLIDDYELSNEITLRPFQAALRREAHVLAERPDLLRVQLYNRLQWAKDVDAQWLAATSEQHKGPWLRLRFPLHDASALIRTLAGHYSNVTACAISPDSSFIVSGDAVGVLKVWDVRTGRERASFKAHANQVSSCVISPDGSFFVSASFDNTLKVWNAQNLEESTTLRSHFDRVNTCAISPDGRYMVSGSNDHSLKVWETGTWKEKITFHGHPLMVNTCIISSDSSLVVSGGFDQWLRVWDLQTAQERFTVMGLTGSANACAMSRNGTFIVGGGDDYTARVWDTQTRAVRFNLRGQGGFVNSCTISPDDSYIVTAGTNHSLMIWDAASGLMRNILQGHTGSVNACTISDDGRFIVSASEDETLKIWGAGMMQDSVSELRGSERINTSALSRDGKVIVTGMRSTNSAHTKPRLWNTDTGQPLAIEFAESCEVIRCAFSADSTFIISTDGRCIKIWDTSSGKVLAALGQGNDSINDLALSPDGTFFVSASGNYMDAENTLIIWDTHTGERRVIFRDPTEAVSACTISPDGMTILSGSRDGTLRFWDSSTGQLVGTPIAIRGGMIKACAISPDRSFIAFINGFGLNIWYTATGKRRFTVPNSPGLGTVYAFAISPDGRFLITTGKVGTLNMLKLWDVQTGQECAEIPLPAEGTCVVMHPWRPYAIQGDKAGKLHFVELARVAYDPLIVTAEDAGSGTYVRCPKCQSIWPPGEAQPGQEISCSTPGCAIHLRINPFILHLPATPVIPVHAELPALPPKGLVSQNNADERSSVAKNSQGSSALPGVQEFIQQYEQTLNVYERLINLVHGGLKVSTIRQARYRST